MLQAFGLTYAPAPSVDALFENLNLSVGDGEKVALVGPNGAGKTKLLQILVGHLSPQLGRVVRPGSVAYLPQDFDLTFEGSMETYLWELGAPRFASIAALERQFEDGEDVADEHAAAMASDAAEEFRHAAARLKKSAARFGLGQDMLRREFQTLSLGERMRGVLAALLAQEPEFLVLDEPTNHLDIEARTWLEHFLIDCREGVLFACHDRALIDAVADRVYELDRGKLTEYAGGYEDMTREKLGRAEREAAAWERARLEERRLKNSAEQALQSAAKMTKRPTGRTYDPKAKAFYAGKQKAMDARAKAILRRVEHAGRETLEKPFAAEELKIQFSFPPLRTENALVVRGLCLVVGERVLFDALSITLPKGARVAIVGPNGVGKTSLFRALLGEMPLERGTIEWAPSARIAYLTQERGALEAGLRLSEALPHDSADDVQRSRTLLACLGLRGAAADKRVRNLSVGERTKAELANLLATPANVLMLDEPTNHLDAPALEALERALEQFPGCVLFTSHDRSFVERIATDRLELG